MLENGVRHDTASVDGALDRLEWGPCGAPTARGLGSSVTRRPNEAAIPCGRWRAHALNNAREHDGPNGEPRLRLFMSNLSTALAALALL